MCAEQSNTNVELFIMYLCNVSYS